MAHLVTKHDPYHIHKVLGLLVLLHYLHRFGLLASTGTCFPDDEPPRRAIAGTVLHCLLSWSSLLLPLPVRRNFTKPMIWPEFRLHSIAFATRHALATALTLAGLWPRGSPALNFLARAGVVLGTIQAASYITDRHGSREQRTTNAMPYPGGVSVDERAAIKRMYTSAQFGATVSTLMDDPSVSFAPLLGIQMAALLMTLVRKGKIGAATYHRAYALSLGLGYVVIFARILAWCKRGEVAEIMRAVLVFNLPFTRLRRRGISARALWTATTLLGTVIYPLFLAGPVERHVSIDVVRKLAWIGLARTLGRQAAVYSPLFAPDATSKKAHGASASATALTSRGGVLTTWGTRGGAVLWSLGMLWLVQCYEASREA